MNFLKKSHLALGIVLCAVIGIMPNLYPSRSSSGLEDMTNAQDVRSLDRRISLIELRLNSIESSVNRLQQSALSQRAPVSQPNVRDEEINPIREDIHSLQLRLGEIECGLLKLDERTTNSVPDNRKSAPAKTVDPCRLNPFTPLRLSTRP